MGGCCSVSRYVMCIDMFHGKLHGSLVPPQQQNILLVGIEWSKTKLIVFRDCSNQ